MPSARIRASISLLLAAFLVAASLSATVRADAAATRQHRLKAAFLYNFVMFVDGVRFDRLFDRKETPDPNEPILIGVIGKDPFGDAFEPLKGKELRNRPVVVKRFKGFEERADTDRRLPPPHPQLKGLRACHVLFICPSEGAHLRRILDPIRTHGILTVADMPGFLEAGGMINFVIEDEKMRFEINTAAAGRAKLQIRARLLRLATRVVRQDGLEEHDDKGNDTPRQEG